MDRPRFRVMVYNKSVFSGRSILFSHKMVDIRREMTQHRSRRLVCSSGSLTPKRPSHLLLWEVLISLPAQP